MKNHLTRRQALACTAATVAGSAIPLAAALANAWPSGGSRPDAILAAVTAWAAAARVESAALHEYTEMIDGCFVTEGRRAGIWHSPAQQEIFDRAVAASRAHRATWYELEDLLFGFHGGFRPPLPVGYLRPPLG
jgi:hypothetical protein